MRWAYRSIGLLLLFGVMLFAGCAGSTADTATAAGELEEGYRIIEISSGFFSDTITVYRGEELLIRYTGDSTDVSASVPDLEYSESSDSGEVELYVKVKEEGTYALVVTDGDVTESGEILVEAYENEAVFKNVDPEEFQSLMTGEYLLLDVRTQDEYNAGHIEGATLISVYELEQRLDEIEAYKDVRVLVYCRSGNRSIVASQILIDEGFNEVYNLLGGYSAWSSFIN